MSSKQKKYTVAIIGAGRIGAGFDTPASPYVLTHAHACNKNSRTTLVGLVDTDATLGKREAKRWGTKYFSSIKTLFAEVKVDMVVIATPDATHAQLLQEVATYAPALIVCEKPPVVSLKEIQSVTRLFAKNNIPVLVNYSRRFDPTVVDIQQKISAGTYGKVLAATGIYAGGLLHNGSHMVDLARFLFGEMSIRKGAVVFEHCPQFALISGDQKKYAIFELDILLEKARIRFTGSGMHVEIQEVISSPIYKAFTVLGRAKVSDTKLHNALPELFRHAVALLDHKEESKSPLANGLATQTAVLELVKKTGKTYY